MDGLQTPGPKKARRLNGKQTVLPIVEPQTPEKEPEPGVATVTRKNFLELNLKGGTRRDIWVKPYGKFLTAAEWGDLKGDNLRRYCRELWQNVLRSRG